MVCLHIILIHYNIIILSCPADVTVSFNETMATVVEGMMLTVVLNIDTGILVGNLTLMVTDGTTSSSKFKTIHSKQCTITVY